MQGERERENSHYGNQSGWNIHQFDEISQRQKPPWGVPSHVSWDPHGNRSGTEPSFLRLTVFTGVHRWKDCSIWYSNVLLQNAVAFQQEIQLVFPQFSLHHFGKRKKPCMCQHIPKPTILDYIGLDIQVSTVHLYWIYGYIIGYSNVGKPVSQTFQWYHPWGIFQAHGAPAWGFRGELSSDSGLGNPRNLVSIYKWIYYGNHWLL